MVCRSKAEGGRRCKSARARGTLSAVVSPGDTSRVRHTDHSRRSRTAVLRDAQQQLSDLLDGVVNAAVSDPTATLVSAADAAVASQVADAITKALESQHCPRAKWQSHLLCGALAAVAHAMNAGEDLARTAITEGVTAALTSVAIPGLAAGLAARAAVDTLMKLGPIQHWDNIRRAFQLLAVSACPKVAAHPAVEQFCLQPLASEFLSDEIQRELATLSGADSATAG